MLRAVVFGCSRCKQPKIALWIVCSPALIFTLALIGMMVAGMFIRDWR